MTFRIPGLASASSVQSAAVAKFSTRLATYESSSLGGASTFLDPPLGPLTPRARQPDPKLLVGLAIDPGLTNDGRDFVDASMSRRARPLTGPPRFFGLSQGGVGGREGGADVEAVPEAEAPPGPGEGLNGWARGLRMVVLEEGGLEEAAVEDKSRSSQRGRTGDDRGPCSQF